MEGERLSHTYLSNCGKIHTKFTSTTIFKCTVQQR
jgi:hypothetical protein